MMIASKPLFPPPRLEWKDEEFFRGFLWSSMRLFRLCWTIIQANVGLKNPFVMDFLMKVMPVISAVHGRSN